MQGAMSRPDLPPLAELTAAERRYLGMRLDRLSGLFGMALGGFAETVVAEALAGAREATAVEINNRLADSPEPQGPTPR